MMLVAFGVLEAKTRMLGHLESVDELNGPNLPEGSRCVLESQRQVGRNEHSSVQNVVGQDVYSTGVSALEMGWTS